MWPRNPPDRNPTIRSTVWKPFAKWARRVDDVSRLAEYMHSALYHAAVRTAGRGRAGNSRQISKGATVDGAIDLTPRRLGPSTAAPSDALDRRGGFGSGSGEAAAHHRR